MRRGRRGSLSRETYFPSTGDHLEDPTEGMVWICAKSNKYKDEHTGVIFKYAFLVGRSSDFEESVPRAVHEEEDFYLDGVTTIRRKLSGPEEIYRIYDYSDATGTWQQRLED